MTRLNLKELLRASHAKPYMTGFSHQAAVGVFVEKITELAENHIRIISAGRASAV